MNEVKIKNQLKSMIVKYLPTLKANNDADNIRDSLFCSHDMENNTFVKIITYSENELFYAPIKFILNQKIFSETYSD